jgi:hypothetical protein
MRGGDRLPSILTEGLRPPMLATLAPPFEFELEPLAAGEGRGRLDGPRAPRNEGLLPVMLSPLEPRGEMPDLGLKRGVSTLARAPLTLATSDFFDLDGVPGEDWLGESILWSLEVRLSLEPRLPDSWESRRLPPPVNPLLGLPGRDLELSLSILMLRESVRRLGAGPAAGAPSDKRGAIPPSAISFSELGRKGAELGVPLGITVRLLPVKGEPGPLLVLRLDEASSAEVLVYTIVSK